VEGDHFTLNQDIIAHCKLGLELLDAVEDPRVDVSGLVGEHENQKGLAGSANVSGLARDQKDGLHPLFFFEISDVDLAHFFEAKLLRWGCVVLPARGRVHGCGRL
jgi:hypothetical protein